MSPTLVITIIVASRIWHFQWNNQMRQFTKLFEMKIPGGSLALRTKGHCLVLSLLKQNNIVLRTMSVDLKIIMIRVSWFFLCRLLWFCFFTRNADVVLLAGWGHWAAPLERNVEHDFLLIITQFSFSRFRYYLSWVKSLNCRKKKWLGVKLSATIEWGDAFRGWGGGVPVHLVYGGGGRLVHWGRGHWCWLVYSIKVQSGPV